MTLLFLCPSAYLECWPVVRRRNAPDACLVELQYTTYSFLDMEKGNLLLSETLDSYLVGGIQTSWSKASSLSCFEGKFQASKFLSVRRRSK